MVYTLFDLAIHFIFVYFSLPNQSYSNHQPFRMTPQNSFVSRGASLEKHLLRPLYLQQSVHRILKKRATFISEPIISQHRKP